MTQAVDAAEFTLSTDFALLGVRQSGCSEVDTRTMTFAGSKPGLIVMMCGTKYADLRVRLERWNGPPPQPGPEWEDCDEVPWQPVDAPEEVRVEGFESSPGDVPLSLSGLGRARVQILARGRHRFGYDTHDPRAHDPERWLLRFWPDPTAGDALAGPPRRVAGPLPFAQSGWSLWATALRAWDRTGWRAMLGGTDGFDELQTAIVRIGRPFTPDDLPPIWAAVSRGEAPTWDSPILRSPPHPLMRGDHDRVQLLASVAKMPRIETFRDAFEFLQRVGLLARCGGPGSVTYVPNAVPAPVWEIPELNDWAPSSRLHALRGEYGHLMNDIQHLLRWSTGDVLRTTARSIAVRLSLDPAEVLGTIRLLELLSGTQVMGTEQPDGDHVLELPVAGLVAAR